MLESIILRTTYRSQSIYIETAADDVKVSATFCYPSSMREFSDAYVAMYRLNDQLKTKKAKADNWRIFDKEEVACEPVVIRKV